MTASSNSLKKRDAGVLVFPLLLGASAILLIAGLILALDQNAPTHRTHVGLALLVAGALGAIGSALAFAISSQLRAAHDAAAHSAESTLATLNERLSALSVMLNVVSEQQLISDRAKAVAYREKDRDALRRAIREEMGRGDWEAARVLVEDMEATFGYRQESDRFRSEISARRDDSLRRQLTDTQDRIERLCRNEDWTAAQQEAARFIATCPDFEPGRNLPGAIEQKRQAHKKHLLDRYNEAVHHHDGDTGMELLRQLDAYLSPAEGERMAESARSIFNDRKSKLREQFTGAVSSHNWPEAIRIGEVIQLEFPNAKFAHEVAETMATLRERAAEDPAVVHA